MARRLQQSRKSSGNGKTDGIVSPETVLEARREITGSKRDLETAQGNHRNVCKRWKNQGVNVKALIEVIQLRRQEPETTVAHFRDVFRYGRIEKAEFALQLDLLNQVRDTEPTGKAREQHQEFEAQEAGYIAGRRGFGQEGAPGKPGDKAHALYLQGWKRGQADIAKQLGKNAKVATSKPRKAPATGTTAANAGRRRGRPPATAAAAAEIPPLLQ
jgi:hypothetical protein